MSSDTSLCPWWATFRSWSHPYFFSPYWQNMTLLFKAQPSGKTVCIYYLQAANNKLKLCNTLGEGRDRVDFFTQLHMPSPLVPYQFPEVLNLPDLLHQKIPSILSCLHSSLVFPPSMWGPPWHVVCPHHLFSSTSHLFICYFTL